MLNNGDTTLPATGHVFVFIFSRFDEKCLNSKMNDSCNIKEPTVCNIYYIIFFMFGNINHSLTLICLNLVKL